MRVIWVSGCRTGSNVLGAFLERCGAFVAATSRPAPNEWNPQWVEDRALRLLAQRLLGREEHLYLQRCAPPDTADEPALAELVAYVRDGVKRAAHRPLLMKMGIVLILRDRLLPEVRDLRHDLVVTRRNRPDRLKSLLRLHPLATPTQVNEFLNRHDRYQDELVADWRSAGRVCVEADFDAIRADPTKLDDVARAVGLVPTAEARSVFDPQRIKTK